MRHNKRVTASIWFNSLSVLLSTVNGVTNVLHWALVAPWRPEKPIGSYRTQFNSTDFCCLAVGRIHMVAQDLIFRPHMRPGEQWIQDWFRQQPSFTLRSMRLQKSSWWKTLFSRTGNACCSTKTNYREIAREWPGYLNDRQTVTTKQTQSPSYLQTLKSDPLTTTFSKRLIETRSPMRSLNGQTNTNKTPMLLSNIH